MTKQTLVGVVLLALGAIVCVSESYDGKLAPGRLAEFQSIVGGAEDLRQCQYGGDCNEAMTSMSMCVTGGGTVISCSPCSGSPNNNKCQTSGCDENREIDFCHYPAETECPNTSSATCGDSMMGTCAITETVKLLSDPVCGGATSYYCTSVPCANATETPCDFTTCS